VQKTNIFLLHNQKLCIFPTKPHWQRISAAKVEILSGKGFQRNTNQIAGF